MHDRHSLPAPAPEADDVGAAVAAYEPGERDLLRAVRDLVRADRGMRRDVGERMAMNSNELLALRHVLESDRAGAATTPRRLAGHLGISTAATTTLLDRLVARGHLDRVPHPSDHRSKLLVATPQARRDVHDQLGAAHERMRAAAAAVPEVDRPAVLAFLAAVTEAMAEPTVEV